MGTTRSDFENPEFVLFGMDNQSAYEKAKELYADNNEQRIQVGVVKLDQ